MKRTFHSLIKFIFSAFLLLGVAAPQAQADYYDCCCDSSWSQYNWILGVALGAAGGAAAGWGAGHHGHKGNRGKKGETGDEGPAAVIPYDNQTPVDLVFNSLILDQASPLEVNVTFALETVGIVGGCLPQEGPLAVDGTTPSGVFWSLPAQQQKLEGDFYVVLLVETGTAGGSDEAIGTFSLDFGNGVIPMTLVSGKVPTIIQPWADGDEIILRGSFNP